MAIRRAALCLTTCGAGVCFTLASAPAQAQDGADPMDRQKVVVTGSRLEHEGGETPSPMQVITAQDLQRTGRTSVKEVLQNLTANGQGTLSQSFPGSFASGAEGVSLRGLSVGATLVLVDGHRIAPYPIGDDGQRSFVDVANLPFTAIDRIEILKDGASALYGSDAIAGVINIVLKRSFTGKELHADLGTSQQGGGAMRHVAGLYGLGDLASDGHNFYVSAEFRKQDQIRFDQRGSLFRQTDFRSSGGDNATPGAHNASVGSHPASGTGYVTSPDGSIVGFMRGCDSGRFAADQCTYGDTYHQILPPTQNLDLLARFTQTLAGTWRLALEASYFDSQSSSTLSPSRTYPGGDEGIMLRPGVTPTVLPALPPTTIPSTNPTYPAGTGLSRANLYYTFLDLGPKINRSEAHTAGAAVQLQGRLGDWDIETSAGYSQVLLNLLGRGFVSSANLQTALDSTTSPYLVGVPNSSSVDAFIAPRLESLSSSRLAFMHADAARGLASLPGGAWTFDLGVDIVRKSLDTTSPANAENGLVTTYSNAYAIGVQQVASVYAETSAPLTPALELDAAARYDHYNIMGGRTSPKLGFRYAASSGIAISGTAGRGFRAPSPMENGNAAQGYALDGINDPVLCADGSAATVGNFTSQCNFPLPGLQTSNRSLRSETSSTYTLGLALRPASGVAAKLDYYSIEIDHQIIPGRVTRVVRGTNFSPIDQLQPDGGTTLVVPPVAPIVYEATTYVNANSTHTDGLDLEVSWHRRIGAFGAFSSNLQVTWIHRYDTTIDGVTYRLAGTHGPSNASGDTGNPRTRVQWANTWERGALDVTATLHFVGPYGVTDPSAIAYTGAPEATCADALSNSGGQAAVDYASALESGQVPAALSCRVHAFTTVDLAVRYAATKHMGLQLSVLNLFNSGAPRDWATYGGSGAPYNPALHLSGAIGRYFTAGASYEF